jgi:hypothetical protein
MHRDALTDLGESLRHEFQELYHHHGAALADLVGDAHRWLETLDLQVQALAAWLTSSSVAAALPLDASLAMEEVASAAHTSLPADAPAVSLVQATPSPVTDLGALTARDTLTDGVDLSQGLPCADETPTADRTRSTTVSTGLTTVPQSDSQAHRASDTAAPTAQIAAPQHQSSDALEPSIRPMTSPEHQDLASTATGGELNAQHLAAGYGDESVRGEASRRGRRAASTTPEEALRDDGERTEFSPPGGVLPPQTVAAGFTTVKNLHDLARLLSIGDPEPAVPLESPTSTQSEGTDAGASSGTPSAPEHLPWSVDPWRPMTSQAQDDEALAPDEAAARPTSAVRGKGVRQERLPGESDADERAATPSQEGVSEDDMESLLDALSRRVAEDYRRYYGS